jgi:sulfite reductase (NADPH) flavoprotein alpha-component
MSKIILYGSKQGTSKKIADEIGSKTGIPVDSIEKKKPDDLKGYSLVVFVVATYGKGEAVPTAVSFWKELNSQSIDLSSVSIAVVACGSSSFKQTFCKFGKDLEAKLVNLGAKKAASEVALHDAKGQQSSNIDAWIATWNK